MEDFVKLKNLAVDNIVMSSFENEYVHFFEKFQLNISDHKEWLKTIEVNKLQYLYLKNIGLLLHEKISLSITKVINGDNEGKLYRKYQNVVKGIVSYINEENNSVNSEWVWIIVEDETKSINDFLRQLKPFIDIN